MILNKTNTKILDEELFPSECFLIETVSLGKVFDRNSFHGKGFLQKLFRRKGFTYKLFLWERFPIEILSLERVNPHNTLSSKGFV